MIVEEASIPDVGEEIVGLNVITAVTAPVIGVADADLEGAEFGDRLFLRRWRHPCNVFEPGTEGDEEVGDDGFGLGLGFGREESFDVNLAYGVAEGVGDEDVAAEVAGTLLGGSGEYGVEEGEALVGEGLGDGGSAVFEKVVDEEIFPRVEGLRGDERGFAGEGGGLPDDEDVLFIKAGGTEELRPIKAGSLCGEVCGMPWVVGFVHVFAVGEGDLLFCDGGFESQHTSGARVWVREAGEAEHRGYVCEVLRADLFHRIGVGQVVVAVGQFAAALKKVGGVVIGVVEAGGDPEAEDVRGVEVSVVEGVDVGAEGEAEGVGEFARCFDSCNFAEVGLEAGEAVGLDGSLVHVGAVEVGDLAFIGAGGSVRFGSVVDDRGDLLGAAVDEDAEDADGGAIGGKLGAGDEAAVSVEVEVVAGADGGVHVGDGDTGV